jgi:preprotein translocase subunit SecE
MKAQTRTWLVTVVIIIMLVLLYMLSKIFAKLVP